MNKYILFFLLALCSQVYSQEYLCSTDCHYKGFIDSKIPVSMDLKINKNDSLSGFYFYDNVGERIDLDGNIDNNNDIFLKETIDYDITGYFKGKRKGGLLYGTWYNPNQTKSFDFKLNENYEHSTKLVYYKASKKIFMYDSSDVAYYDITIDVCFPNQTPLPRGKDSIIKSLKRFYFDTFAQPNIDASIDSFINDLKDDFLSNKKVFTYDEIKDDSYKWHFNLFGDPVFNQNDFLIIYKAREGYSGGAHHWYSDRFVTFDLKTGKIWRLKDIFKTDKMQALALLIRDKLRKKNYDCIFSYDSIEPSDNFYFTTKKFTFYYDVYEVACYTTGAIEVTFDFSELQNFLTDKFKKRMFK